MAKITGLIFAWGSGPFARPVMEQAAYMCDEVLVCVEAHTDNMRKYEDETLEIFKEYPVKLVTVEHQGNHVTTKNVTLNKMLQQSEYFQPGNWLWLLDDDEFYSKETIDDMKKIVEESKHDSILFNERFYYINLHRYLNQSTGRARLWKIQKDSDYFVPTQVWSSPPQNQIRTGLMHHLSFLCNPYAKEDFWMTEYDHNQNHKAQWMRDVYQRVSLEDEDYWLDYCAKTYGHRNLFHIAKGQSHGDEQGRLFHREDTLPQWIEHLEGIEDFREIYERPA